MEAPIEQQGLGATAGLSAGFNNACMRACVYINAITYIHLSLLCCLPLVPPAALSADDRGGFKTCRQLMEPVIEEMRAAAEGEDDGLLMKAVSCARRACSRAQAGAVCAA